jgi:hypothetical protein
MTLATSIAISTSISSTLFSSSSGSKIAKFAAVILLGCASTLARAQSAPTNEGVQWDFPDFTANQIFPSSHNMSMEVYRSGPNVRMDRSAAWSTLYLNSTHKIYNLTSYPDGSHQCVVLRPDQVKMLPSPLELLNGTKIKRTPAGTEVAEGHTCKIENVVVTRVTGETIESKVWEAEDLKGIPVKIESQLPGSKLTALYHDIVVGAPDKALFIPPDKCTPFEKMGQVVEQVNVK